MITLLERHLQRQIFLYDLLSQYEQVRVMDVSKMSNTDYRTLTKDLTAIINIESSITIEQNARFILIKKKSLNPSYFHQEILLESMRVRLLLALLNKNVTLKSLENSLHCSLSTIKRNINYCNDFFIKKGMDITIHISPKVEICGDESIIRVLYQHLIIEIYAYFQESNPNYGNFVMYFESFLKRHFPEQNNLISLEYLSIYIYVSLLRHHYTSPDDSELSPLQKYLHNAIKNDIAFQHILIRSFNITADSINYQILLPRKLNFLFNKYIDENYTPEYFNKNYLFIKNLIEHLNKDVTNILTESALNEKYTLLTLNYMYQQDIVFFSYNPYNIFFKKINQTNPKVGKKYMEYLANFKQTGFSDLSDKELELFYYICRIFPEIITSQEKEITHTIAVCMLYKVNEFSARLFLTKYLPENISFITINSNQLNEKSTATSVDLILTDHPILVHDSIPVVAYPTVPNLELIVEINKML